ncbi:hypothetical protein O152_gp002 [Pseudomonas phage PaBG]|uniref:Uncharacterized protein n=1 Tax=Pseudomonas phage PaBG TaxID=1335230 RepID=S5WK50_9CAUD|nr:hypothetical protein O152_gp002 [Pseudomonas phage PaBG]AGS81886.1 hypothetical protein PaBG_00002 [Pseudomonas phage PaBG]
MVRLVIATVAPRATNLALTYTDGGEERTLFVSHSDVNAEEAVKLAGDAPLAFTLREDGTPNPLRAMQRELGNVCASELIPQIIELVNADLS